MLSAGRLAAHHCRCSGTIGATEEEVGAVEAIQQRGLLMQGASLAIAKTKVSEGELYLRGRHEPGIGVICWASVVSRAWRNDAGLGGMQGRRWRLPTGF
jgi:hypothetical protein